MVSVRGQPLSPRGEHARDSGRRHRRWKARWAIVRQGHGDHRNGDARWGCAGVGPVLCSTSCSYAMHVHMCQGGYVKVCM